MLSAVFDKVSELADLKGDPIHSVSCARDISLRLTPLIYPLLLTNAQHDSTAVYPGHVNTLKISTSSQEAWVAASEHEFPTYGPGATHIECTNGKPGGMNYGDNLWVWGEAGT